MKNTKNIMIVGVGGQGTLLASRILGNVLISAGYAVKVSEVHGMSQRGGSVVTYVKYGKEVYSPIIDKGEADTILAFELLEAYRALPYLAKGGKMLSGTQKIDPMPVITGASAYPENLIETISAACDLTTCDAIAGAKEAGNAKCANVVLIGMLAKNSDIAKETWLEVLRECVPQKALDANLRAFEIGYAQA